MSVPYYHVDAFTGSLFAGNPAGVCLLAGELPDNVLQSIAAENNLPETAFLIQRESHFDLRWFSPTVEIDLCGHATLASAHVLFRHLGYRGEEVRFQTRSGELTVTRDGELLSLDFPSRPAEPCELPADLLIGLGRHPAYLAKARDYLAVFESEQTVREMRPDMAALMRIDAHAFIVTAPGDRSDFVSRFFAPHVGVPEDPVTGSAHCTLIPYWAQRLAKSKLHALQISTRGGELFCQDRGQRVGIAGRAVTYSCGFIHL
jgi:PhzF family phenazine biosynthesis protein